MPLLDDALKKQAEEAKATGNAAFASGNLTDAMSSYGLGLVALERIGGGAPASLKATLLSNRAMCCLKTGQFQSAIDDCTAALQALLDSSNSSSSSSATATDGEGTNRLRTKILFRRAKARFLQYEVTAAASDAAGTSAVSSSFNSQLLQDAAKDLLELLNYDSSNAEASQLLRTIRASHHTLQALSKASNTPVSRTLESLREALVFSKKGEVSHQLKVLLGFLDSDPMNAGVEIARSGGVNQLLDLVEACLESKSSPSGREMVLAAQCVSAAAANPSFVRAYLSDVVVQVRLERLVSLCSCAENADANTLSDLVVSIMAIYDRLLLHLDRDSLDPQAPINGTTGVSADLLVSSCQSALKMGSKSVIRAVLDVLNVWTSGTDRTAAIRASLGTLLDPLLPPPVTQSEIRSMTPQELAAHRKREYEQKMRDQAWASERGLYLLNTVPRITETTSARPQSASRTGLQSLLAAATECSDHVVRREITMTVGRVLAGIESEDKLKELLGPVLGSGGGSSAVGRVVIEEFEEGSGETKVPDDDVPSLEAIMSRALLTTALLLSKKEVGAWALSSCIWEACFDDLTRMIESGDVRAMCMASEVISAAATLESAKDVIQSLITGGHIQTLLTSDDRDIRSGAASAIAKVGLADKATSSDEAELMALLQGAGDLLEDKGEASEKVAEGSKKGTAKLHHFSSFASSSIERGVEMLTYLVANTVIKEEVAAGFQVPDVPRTILERLVEVSTMPNAGESLSGFGLATIFQHLVVTNLQLRKEMFEGKEVTMEQYDEMQKMGKTEEEKEMMEQERDLDTQDACNERIRKLANAHVPRAIVSLMEGASDHTLEQLVLAMNRMAAEPSVRGIMIQQGVLSACIKIEKNEGPTETDTMCKVIRLARHCIAKLLITTNPNLLTAAQRLGSVRPLIQLVRDIKASDLQYFEALLALTNIASSGEDAKNRIVSEKGIAPLHFAMFSDHEMVQRAATEAMCNLVPHKAMMDHLAQAENLKLWLAFASDYEQRYECARAAAGCLAMATQDEAIAVELITLEKFDTHMMSMLESGRLEVMHRTLYIVLNLVAHGGECKDKIVSDGLAAFCKVYADKYDDNHGTADLEFSPEERALLPVTVELAKKIVSQSD